MKGKCMNNNLATEKRKQRRLEKLGHNNPVCGTCGERDWRCLELHHVADRDRDDLTVAICRNCHRKVSDDQKDHPVFNSNADPMLDCIGHFLLGLADLLKVIIERLHVFAHMLIERAALQEKKS
jgi:hypothetical protein